MSTPVGTCVPPEPDTDLGAIKAALAELND
jgi:hypothetical protein